MSDPFLEALVASTIDRVITCNSRRIALLGLSSATLGVHSALASAGLADRLIGIFDDQPLHDGVTQPLSRLVNTPHDLLVVGVDAAKAEMLLAYKRHVGDSVQPLPEVVLAGTAHLAYKDPDFEALNSPALVPSYATGSAYTREHLFQCLQASARARLRGAIVEFGAFKGGTIAWLARAAAFLGLEGCRVVGFDTWTGFPPRRSVLDLYKHPRCVFTEYDAVRAYVEPFGVELVAGDISDTYVSLSGQALLLCFFDTDNYSPARAALELCARQLVVGGSIVFDHVATTPDYVDTLGERIAAYEVLQSAAFLHLHGTGVFTKVADDP